MQGKNGHERKTRVCYIITKGVWGGAQKYVYNLATKLPADEYEVSVITGEGEVLKNKLEERNIKVYKLDELKRDSSFFSPITIGLKILKILYRERPDIIHLNSPKASGIGAVAGRLLFIRKIIQTVHGWTFNEERGFTQETLIYFFSWLTLVLCHKTIVIAPREEEQALAMPFVSKEKIVLIRNGVETVDYKERNLAQKELVSLTDKDIVGNPLWIGTVAELHKNKGLEYAIEAVSKIRTPFVFFIIGEGEERKKLENLIRKYALEDKVFLIGFLGKAMEHLKAFDIFMLTSIKEGLPYSILEAGLAGLPVIASSVGGIPDIIENGVSGILTTKSRTGEIIRALEYMMEKPKERKSFGDALRLKVQKEFSIEQMMEKIVDLYSDHFVFGN